MDNITKDILIIPSDILLIKDKADHFNIIFNNDILRRIKHMHDLMHIKYVFIIFDSDYEYSYDESDYNPTRSYIKFCISNKLKNENVFSYQKFISESLLFHIWRIVNNNFEAILSIDLKEFDNIQSRCLCISNKSFDSRKIELEPASNIFEEYK